MPQQIKHAGRVPDFTTGGQDSGLPELFADLAQAETLCAQRVSLLDRDRLVSGRALCALTSSALFLGLTRQCQESSAL